MILLGLQVSRAVVWITIPMVSSSMASQNRNNIEAAVMETRDQKFRVLLR